MRFFSFCIVLLFCSCRSEEKVDISFPEGGFKYPQEVTEAGNSFFKYPEKDSLSYFDSITTAYYDPLFFGSFHEPNLSLRPPKENIIRLMYETAFYDYAALLILTRDKIIVKAVKKGYPYGYPDENLLDSTESRNLNLLVQFYLWGDKYRDKDKKFSDSIHQAIPRLSDPLYYIHLLKKSTSKMSESFKYDKWTQSLSREKYLYFINKLNSSEYWKIGPEPPCSSGSTDGFTYNLEAATIDKHHAVAFTDCKEQLPLLSAFAAELMNYAGVWAHEDKRREEQLKEFRLKQK